MHQPRMRYPDEVVVRAKAGFDLVGAIGQLTKLKSAGRLMSGRCPDPAHRDRDASFVVNPSRNLYHCYAPSCRLNEKWFSPIDWMIDFRGAADFNEAMEMLGGVRDPLPAPVRRKMAAEQEAKAKQAEDDAKKQAEDGRLKGRKIFAAGGPMKGTLGETYLIEGRGLAGLDVTAPALRFHADLPYWHEVKKNVFRVIHSGPAMLAAFQDRWGNFSAVHQTWLLPDGSGKAVIEFEGEEGLERLPAKKIRGPFMGSAIRLTPPAKLMLCGEGIETTGEIARLHRPGTGAWVAGTMGNLTGRFHPDAPRAPHPTDPKRRLPAIVPDMTSLRMAVPDICKTEILIADGDTKDLHALHALLDMAERRIRQEGRAAGQLWPPGRQDLNDWGRQLRKADCAQLAPVHCKAMNESDQVKASTEEEARHV
ncbi:CHC2 zinc finger [Cohaesibacter sp. ES.047]|nr:CHC2 zinc finger [Cohaesibacter sp. ES.047]